MEYIGSYFYFKLAHIAYLYANNTHQFLAILLDNNTVEVVNLYTQALLFSARPLEESSKANFVLKNRPDSSMHSSSMMRSSQMRHRGLQVNKSSAINLVSFMEETISNCFLSVISRTGKVTHFTEKGIMTSSLNLEDRVGDLPMGAMVYE